MEPLKKIVFIVNPISGTIDKDSILASIKEEINRAEYAYEVAYTQYAKHGTEITARAVSDGADMVVAIGEASKNFNGMIRMNETGAFYWKELEQGVTEDDLVAKTMERFTDVTEETARQDVQAFLQSISIALDSNAAND